MEGVNGKNIIELQHPLLILIIPHYPLLISVPKEEVEQGYPEFIINTNIENYNFKVQQNQMRSKTIYFSVLEDGTTVFSCGNLNVLKEYITENKQILDQKLNTLNCNITNKYFG